MIGVPHAAGAGNAAELPAQVLMALAAILVTARLAGAAARRVGQPSVVGEILAGLALGPSLLGLFPGDLTHALFPAQTRPVLSSVAQLGLVLFMFLVGLESDMGLLRGRVRTAASVSLASIALPFALGVPLALALHDRHDAGEAADLLPFLLFLGASLSITAFPVLARILAERSMERTPLGALALASAALDDVIAWSMLAVVVAIVANGGAASAGLVGVLSVVYAVVMLLVVRPGLTRLTPRLHRDGALNPEAFTVVLVLLLLSAWVTDRIGIHLVFGAFALGAVFPRDGAFRQAVAERVESVSLLLLPVFFVSTGLGVDLAAMGTQDLAELGLVLVVAIVGKIGGAMLGARANGLGLRRSTALGVLANTRGLTELVILSIGRQLGVLDERLYGVLVLMAVITTAMAGPLLRLVYPDRLVQLDLADLDRAAEGASTVVVELPGDERSRTDGSRAQAVAVGADLARSATKGHLVLSRVLPPPAAGLGVAALAELAGVLDEVTRECRSLEPLGLSAAPTVTRTADPAAHAAQQAARLEADWVVATAPVWTGTDVVVAGPRTGDPAPTAPVLLTDDEAAAWEAAVRLARARGVPLAVSAGRATRRLEEAAREVGLTVAEVADGAPVSLVVTGPAPPAPPGPDAPARAAAPVVTVYPGPDGPRELRDRVERILMGVPDQDPEPALSSSAPLSRAPLTVAASPEEPS